jgi:hypothetical protein
MFCPSTDVRVPAFDCSDTTLFSFLSSFSGPHNELLPGTLPCFATFADMERLTSHAGLGSREYGRRNRHADHATPLYPQKSALTSPTSGGRSVGIVR